MTQYIDGTNVRHHVTGRENYIDIHSTPLSNGRVSVALTTRNKGTDLTFEDTTLFLPLEQAQVLLSSLTVAVAQQELTLLNA